ncbi:reverse transcriptase domain-containing protein [Tanacetum coccineum]
MPFGLRNARATYQHLVDKAFHKQIGRNLEVYVDDLVIKSRTEDEIVRDIEETFKTLREINIKLNPKKYTFGVEDRIPKMLKGRTKVKWKARKPEQHKQRKRTVRRSPDTNREANKCPFTCQQAVRVLSRLRYRRLQKWSIELGDYTIHYRPRVSVKGQILADFIVERPKEDSQDTLMEVEEELPEPWILFTDGSSYTDGSGAGLILTNPERMKFTYALRFRFNATNKKRNTKL